MSEKKSGFIQVTWKEIVATVISMLIVSAVAFVFSNFNGRLTEVEDQGDINKDKIETIDILMDAELRDAINDLTEELEDKADELTTFGNNQRSLERTMTRLETIVERLEDKVQ